MDPDTEHRLSEDEGRHDGATISDGVEEILGASALQTPDRDAEHRRGVIAGLRELADALEDHPRMPLPGGMSTWSDLTAYASVQAESEMVDGELVTESQLEFMGRVARHVPGKLEKDGNDVTFKLGRKFGTLQIYYAADRQEVCIQKKVGTTTEKKPHVITPAVTTEIEVEVDVYEWECLPLLDRSAA